ncbi:hypothetical protein [Eubacterium sp.]|uniref:hypothetical protein n=1 Tax=Eubacterium sp. TaxID=142586 RepID=UPI002FCA5114
MAINSSIVSALKKLAVKIRGSGTASDIPGHSVSEVIAEMAGDYKSVTGIALVKNSSGVITGGTITFSDGTTKAITLTEG